MRLPRFVFAAPVLLVLLAGLAAGDSEKAPQIPEGASSFAGHHYLLVDEVDGLSWASAQQACSSQGGHLAVVTSREEADFIADLCDGRYMFLGATDEEQDGVWVWVDGSPWLFTHWMQGQPNDYNGEEDYLATYDDGEWVDVAGAGSDFWMPTGYICEWDR